MKKFWQDYQIEIVILSLLAIMVALFCLTGCVPRRPQFVDEGFASSIGGTINWLVTIAIIGVGACVAAAIFLPVKQIAVAGAAGFAAILTLALTVIAIQPFLPYFAIALGVALLGCGIWYFRKYVMATHAAVEFGNAMSVAQTDEDAKYVKARAAVTQAATGVKSIIDSVRDKVK